MYSSKPRTHHVASEVYLPVAIPITIIYDHYIND
jgi:hypothetical protein